MYVVSIDQDQCTGCGECTKTCPADLLSLNGQGKAEVSGEPTDCMGCESCVSVCPSGAAKVQEC
ncbi:MAG: hypothetical protein PWP65_781 [Clostridia bacterium]|nr:hypothetical protein [Clostridia bacterium]